MHAVALAIISVRITLEKGPGNCTSFLNSSWTANHSRSELPRACFTSRCATGSQRQFWQIRVGAASKLVVLVMSGSGCSDVVVVRVRTQRLQVPTKCKTDGWTARTRARCAAPPIPCVSESRLSMLMLMPKSSILLVTRQVL